MRRMKSIAERLITEGAENESTEGAALKHRRSPVEAPKARNMKAQGKREARRPGLSVSTPIEA